jgi:hypothetical protein
MKLLNVLITLCCLGLFQPLDTRAQVMGELGFSFGSGMDKMSDLNFYGINMVMGFKQPCSDWTYGFSYEQKEFGRREERLPMYTDFSGYGDNVLVTNTAKGRYSHFFVSYNPKLHEKNIFPFFTVGFGWSTYFMIWDTQGSPIPGETVFFGLYNLYDHVEDGLGFRNRTYSTLGEFGLNYVWARSPDECGVFSSGFSIRFEYGGLVNFMNPKRRYEHFYFESGLGENGNAPFAQNPSQSYFSVGRQMMFSLRVVLFKLIL